MISIFKLRDRGIVLVLVPLLLQIFFVIVLVNSLLQMKSDLVTQSRSRKIISQAHIVTRDLAQILTRVFFERKQKKALIDQQQLRDEAANLLGPFRLLIKLAKEDPAQAPNLSALQKTANTMNATFEDICDAQDQGYEHWKKLRKIYDQRVYESFSNFLRQVQAIIDTEAAKRDLKPALSEEFKIRMLVIVFAGIAFSVLLAISCGIVFALAIQKPINHIAENSRRMSKRKPLLPALKGRDELSDLDRLLHSAANGIEQALRKEQSMVDNAVDMICTLDHDGHFRRVNLAAQRLTGWPIENLIRRSVFDLIIAEDVIVAEGNFRHVKSSSQTSTFDLRLLRKNGEIVDTRWSCLYSARDDDVFAVVHDITEEKNVERLKQDFLDMITHDLRSPLTSMSGTLTLIAEGVKGEVSSPVKKEVETALSNVEHLIEFVNDLLDFQKLKAGRMQMQISSCSLDSLFAESIALVQDFASSRTVQINMVPCFLKMKVDRTKFTQLMVNLLSNAIKFSPQDGQIDVHVDDNVESITVHVLDQGPGIPDHLKTKIFEAFEQAPGAAKTHEGTGLGLAICKLIVETHKGIIGVNTSPHGSDFWFTLIKEEESGPSS